MTGLAASNRANEQLILRDASQQGTVIRHVTHGVLQSCGFGAPSSLDPRPKEPCRPRPRPIALRASRQLAAGGATAAAARRKRGSWRERIEAEDRHRRRHGAAV